MLKRMVAAVVVMCVACGVAFADRAYYVVPLEGLEVSGGELPERVFTGWSGMTTRARVVLDGEGEAYAARSARASDASGRRNRDGGQSALAIATPSAREVTGHLYLDSTKLAFRVPSDAADPAQKEEFFHVKARYYRNLWRSGLPGAAWFRYQADLARNEAAEVSGVPVEVDDALVRSRRQSTTDVEDSYNLLTGGRAVSENLALDRVVEAEGDGSPTVAVDSITGITTHPMDWEPLVKDTDPDLDALAHLVPSDQHAIFFPDFSRFLRMMDEARDKGTPILRLMEMRSEDARVHQRYQKQLCLQADALSRMIGPSVVKSVAITGGDPYMRTGTDVAVLFEAKDVAVLRPMIDGRVTTHAQGAQGVEAVKGETSGVPYAGYRSPDRSVCSYVATVGDAVVVTNSLAQLERIADAGDGKTESLAELDEYKFFRHRYSKGDADETALLVVSDPTIRRWCGPAWRIAASRRTRAAAVMADVQARHVDALVKGTVTPGPVDTEFPLPNAGEMSIGAQGVQSSVYGTLKFMTPIIEIAPSKVTDAEAQGYNRWRDRYERRWRRVFDPIAIRFGVSDRRLTGDLTVIPLVEGTEYSQVRNLTRGAQIDPGDGDPHEGTIIHYAMAIDIESEPMREFSGFARSMVSSFRQEPLSWMGGTLSVYADESPRWQELAKLEDEDGDFLEEILGGLPIVLCVEVKNAVRLTVFLTALRGYIESSAPGMTVWETLEYAGQPYVKVTPSRSAVSQAAPAFADVALYYSPSPQDLLVTFSEPALKRALDRRNARAEAAADGEPTPKQEHAWLGESMCLQVSKRFVEVVRDLSVSSYQRAMKRRCYANLPILNEWHDRYPDRDPVDVHRRVWQTEPVCPGGGEYVWNEEWQTVESTVYGHPGEQKDGPSWPKAALDVLFANLGVTFENDGLRARAEIDRDTTSN